MFCNQCGTQLKEGIAFCNNCGNKLNSNKQVVAEDFMHYSDGGNSDILDKSTWVGSLPFIANAKMIITKKYSTTSGRATRGEFWKFVLFEYILLAIPAIMMLLGMRGSFAKILFWIPILALLATMFPAYAVSFRRLQDIGKNGYYCLILHFIPVIGQLILLYWFCKPTQFYTNKYGPVPDYSNYIE